MVHSCVDWTAGSPVRKTPLMVLSYGDVHTYVKVPDLFEDLEALSREKFGLDTAYLGFYTSCINFCSDALAEITLDIWEYAAPCIGCITVVKKKSASQQPAMAKTPSETTLIPIKAHSAPASPPTPTVDVHHDSPPSINNGATSHTDGAAAGGASLSAPAEKPTEKTDHHVAGNNVAQIPPAIKHDAIIPLQKSPNRWVAPSMTRSKELNEISYYSDTIVRKVTGLLNKLSPSDAGEDVTGPFESGPNLFREITLWMNKCKGEDGKQALPRIAHSIFVRAINEPQRASLYADLCQKVSLNTRATVNFNGEEMTVELYFRRCLFTRLNRAIMGDIRACRSMDGISPGNRERDDKDKVSAEWRATQNAKHHSSLALINFCCELVRHYVFNEDIISDYLSDLVLNVENLTNRELEYACRLLRMAGKLLDLPETRMRMDVYFTRIMQSIKNPDLSPKLHCYLLDVADLRARGWEHRPVEVTCDVGEAEPWDQYTDEFLTYGDLKQAENYFENIEEEYHDEFVASLITPTLEGKEADARRVAAFFAQARAKKECSKEIFEAGFLSATSCFDEILIDAPKALDYLAIMLKGAGFCLNQRGLERIARKISAGMKLIELVLWKDQEPQVLRG